MHKIHVEQGMEYQGETYIWCECTVPEKLINRYHFRGVYTWGKDFYPWFTGESPEELAAWLTEHSCEESRRMIQPRSNMKNPAFLVPGMRALADKIKADPDNQTREAVLFAEYFTDLDDKLCAEPDFPRDWVPF